MNSFPKHRIKAYSFDSLVGEGEVDDGIEFVVNTITHVNPFEESRLKANLRKVIDGLKPNSVTIKEIDEK